QYLEELKFILNEINKKDEEVIGEDYYEWEINNWNELTSTKYSPIFKAGNYEWKLCIYPNGKNDEEYISLYLYSESASNINENSYISTKYIMTIRNHNNYSCFKYKRSENLLHFTKENTQYGESKYLHKNDLYKKNNNFKGLIEDNTIIIGAYIRVYKSEIKNK
ncbi:hypothetical protein PIROE2DRAFT_9914, partial [Piromyces sp. E2]